MYKIVNQFAQGPGQNFFLKVSVTVGINYGIEYQKIFEIRYLTTRFVKTFSPRPPNY
jgi:hypothetical protein